jgi:hypothetical protein
MKPLADLWIENKSGWKILPSQYAMQQRKLNRCIEMIQLIKTGSTIIVATQRLFSRAAATQHMQC